MSTTATPAEDDVAYALWAVMGRRGRADPHPYFASIRESKAVHHIGDAYATGRYEQALTVLRDDRFAAAETDRCPVDVSHPENDRMRSAWPVLTDGERHTTLRRLARAPLTTTAVKELGAEVSGLADEHLSLNGIGVGTIIELMGPLRSISATVNARVLGLTPGATIPEPATRIAGRHLDPFRAGRERRFPTAEPASFNAIMKEVVDSAPSGVAAMCRHAVDAGELTRDEATSLAGFVAGAGTDTTSGFVGNAVSALCAWPDQWQRLVTGDVTIEAAIEELLRFDSSLQVIARVACTDVELGNETVPAGAAVSVLLPAANRDPRQFDEPDQLRLDRNPKHVAFGFGHHVCLGANLARIHARLVLGHLASRVAAMSLVEPVRWERDSMILRVPASIVVRVDALT